MPYGVENIVRKGEMSPFLTMFSTAVHQNTALCGNRLRCWIRVTS